MQDKISFRNETSKVIKVFAAKIYCVCNTVYTMDDFHTFYILLTRNICCGPDK